MSTVSEHERTRNGRTEHVRRHDRTDPGMSEKDLNKRDAFERRVLRERQAARRGKPLTAGRAKARPSSARCRALRAANSALDAVHARRGWRALFYAGLGVAFLGAWGISSAGRSLSKSLKHFWNEVPA